MTGLKPRRPAVEGWFTIDDEPVLLGNRCTACATVFFPKAAGFCRNPGCEGTEFAETRLSRTGTVWSFTDAQYQPPPPFVPAGGAGGEFEPFALAAVELAEEGLVVLGQVASGYGVADLAVGDPVELVVEPLTETDEAVEVVWKWRPC